MGPGTLRGPHAKFLSHMCKNRIGLFSLQEHSFTRTSWAGDHVLFQWARHAGGTSLGSREPGVLDGRVTLSSSSRGRAGRACESQALRSSSCSGGLPVTRILVPHRARPCSLVRPSVLLELCQCSLRRGQPWARPPVSPGLSPRGEAEERGEVCGTVWNLLFSSPPGDSGITVLRPPAGRGLSTQCL